MAGVLLISSSVRAEDWPQYKKDGQRSSISSEQLTFPLKAAWTYAPAQAPQPAWPEPGKELNRIDFDYAPQAVIADGRVFFASTADDTVRAMEQSSGKLLWRFTANAPIRFAPAVDQGKVFVASDDGFVYCLDAATGKLVWKFGAAPAEDQLIGNGRMISRWPLRSGLLVMNGVVNVVAGMWPDEGIHVYSLDEKTGNVVWRNDTSGSLYVELPHPTASGFSGVTPQGYLSASDDVLVVPTGRSIPAGFDRKNGDLMYYEPGLYAIKRDGGCWSSVYKDYYFNPLHGARGGAAKSGEAPPIKIDGIGCYDIRTGKTVFDLPFTTEVLANGDRLYAAGGDSLVCYDFNKLLKGGSASKAVIWTKPHARMYNLAQAANALLVGSTDKIEAFDPATGNALWSADAPGQVRGISISNGNIIASTNKGMVACFAPNGNAATVFDHAPDNSKNTLNTLIQPADVDAQAKSIVSTSGKSEGYALVVGSDARAMAQALAASTKLHVIQPTVDEAQALDERKSLLEAGLYGSHVAVPVINGNSRLPFAPYWADLVVVAGKSDGLSAEETYRCLRPCGGTLIVAESPMADAIVKLANAPSDTVKKDAGFVTVVRGALPDSGVWDHCKANSGNTSIGSDKRLKMPLELLWFGGPGPDRMMDRHDRTSTPLSVNGRIFITGENTLICVDAYNGRELWSVPMEGLGRRTADVNCGNTVADDKTIFAIIGSTCYRMDQATGKQLATFSIPAEVSANPAGWGFVDLADGMLIGSVLEKPWTAKDVNTNVALFALNLKDGSLKWQYKAQIPIPCPSIAIGAGRVYCLEMPDVAGKGRRRGVTSSNPRLIALNVADGQVVWHQENAAASWPVVQFANDVVITGGSAAYKAENGEPLWHEQTGAPRQPPIQGDWLITQPFAYNIKTGEQKMTQDQLTGLERPWEFLRNKGCGSISGCDSLLFFRSGSSAFYDFESDGTTNWGGVKPGCGISMISANGLVLMPEASSGCGCSYNYQTSLALIPAEDRQREKWFVFPGKVQPDPLKALRVNLGAPGDRKDEQGNAWVSYPRPIMPGAMPVSLTLSSKTADFYRHNREDKLPANQTPWLYAAGLRNPGTINVDLFPARPLEILPVSSPIIIDGKMDESLAKGSESKINMDFIAYRTDAGGEGGDEMDEESPAAEPTSEPTKPAIDLRDFKSNAFLREDDQNLYLTIQSPSPMLTEGRATWAAKQKGEDAKVWLDDSWEVFLTDSNRQKTIHLGVSASGARFDALWSQGMDAKWNADWKSAVLTNDKEMVVEMAIPWGVFQSAGLDRKHLMLNLEGTGPNGLGSPAFAVGNDHFSQRWTGKLNVPTADTYTFTYLADDINALYIDGKKVLDFMNILVANPSTPDPPTPRSATVQLTAGAHSIQIDHADRRGTSEAHLFWKTATMPQTIIPASAFTTPDGKPGLKVEYWNGDIYGIPKKAAPGTKPSPPILTSVDSNVDFNYGPSGWRSELAKQGEVRPALSRAYVALMDQSDMPKTSRSYTVRLHFAEMDGMQAGQRVFDVKLQDKTVLPAFDICKEVGCDKPLVKEFKGIVAPRDSIKVDLSPVGKNAGEPPILSAIEVALEK